MTFRHTRRTNDLLGWVTFGACLPGAVLADVIVVAIVRVWVMTAVGGEGLLCFGPLAIAFTVAAVFAGWRTIRPQEWEFVVDEGVIRWGPTPHPERQQRVLLGDVRRVVVDSGIRKMGVLLETRAGQTIGDDFALIQKADRQALVLFMPQYHPAIPCVYGR